MARRINYDDDVFFLELRLRHIQQAEKLDVDDAPYVDCLVEDLRFIDRCIRSLYASLDDARQVTTRSEHLSQLASLTEEYASFLIQNRYATSALARRMATGEASVASLADVHATLAEQMRSDAAELEQPLSHEQQVSPEELHHLLLDDAEGA